MPWKIVKRDGSACVVEKDGDEEVMCYTGDEAEEKAKRLMAALYASEPEAAGKAADDEGDDEKPTYACECLKCGHKMETKEHCADVKCPECGGEMRRQERPGPGKATDGEREEVREAQEARAKKHGIAAKKGKPVTKPSEYGDVPDASFGDPVNYSYPADAEHARPALSYFNQKGQREDGGYTSEEWGVIGGRLAKLLSKHLEADYEYRDGKLAHKEKEGKSISLDNETRRIRDAWREKFKRRRSTVPTVVEPDNYDYWVKEVMDDSVIVEAPDGLYSYPYIIGEGDEIEWGDPVKVKVEYVPVPSTTRTAAFAVKSLGETEEAWRVGGYGIVWGNEQQRDLSPWPNKDGSKGEYFTPATTALNDIPVKVMTFEHDKEKDEQGNHIKEALGHTVLERNDLRGRWIEAQVHKGKRYAQYVMDLLAQGKLYLSSETASHWRDVADNGEIKRWRTAGYTFTTHPMEPRIGEIDALKSYFKGANLDFPDDDSDDGEDSTGVLGQNAEIEKAKALVELELELLELVGLARR